MGYPEACLSPLAARIALIEPFLAMEVMERAFAIERAGGKVLHLEIGEPDFPPPPAAVEACAAALREGETRYTDSRGLLELREAIAADLARRFAVSVDPERVIVTSGTSPAMLLVFSLLVDPGDEVVIGTPHYPCYPSFVRACGGVPVFVPTDPARGYPLDPDAVRAALTPRTRAIVVGSPANPTGAVQSAETLRAIAALGAAARLRRDLRRARLRRRARDLGARGQRRRLRARRLLEALCDDRLPARLARRAARARAAAPDPGAEPVHLGEPLRAARGHRGARARRSERARDARRLRAAPRPHGRGPARARLRRAARARRRVLRVRRRARVRRATRARSRSICSSARTSAPRPASTSAPRARAGCASRTRRPTRRSRRRSRGSRRRCRRGDEPQAAGAARSRVAELITSAASASGFPRAGPARDRVPGPLERRQVEPAQRAGRAPRARAHLVDARQDAPAQLVPRRARRPRALARRPAGLWLCEGREDRARGVEALDRGLPRRPPDAAPRGAAPGPAPRPGRGRDAAAARGSPSATCPRSSR